MTNDKLAVGDYVSRDGTDVHLVQSLDSDAYHGSFVCVVRPSSGWCAVGEVEPNVCRRYSRVDDRCNAGISVWKGSSVGVSTLQNLVFRNLACRRCRRCPPQRCLPGPRGRARILKAARDSRGYLVA